MRYQELIDSSLINNITLIQSAGSSAKSIEDFQNVFKGTNALNMLNTKYVIYSQDAPPLVNQNALGNAWFVETPVFVDNANGELAAVNKINPSTEAAIDKTFSDLVTKSSYPGSEGDKIELISYKPNELIYKSTTKQERLTVFSDIYYPAGWESYIDDKENKYFRADYVLRAMVIPAGEHEIRFVFKPSSYRIGNRISSASSVLLIIITIGYFYSILKIKPKAE